MCILRFTMFQLIRNASFTHIRAFPHLSYSNMDSKCQAAQAWCSFGPLVCTTWSDSAGQCIFSASSTLTSSLSCRQFFKTNMAHTRRCHLCLLNSIPSNSGWCSYFPRLSMYWYCSRNLSQWQVHCKRVEHVPSTCDRRTYPYSKDKSLESGI